MMELYPPSLTVIGDINQIIRDMIITDVKTPPAEGQDQVVVPVASQ